MKNILVKFMKAIIIAMCFSCMYIATASAKTYSSYTYGSGTNSCGTWVKWRKTESGWYQDSQWVQGYISSYSSYGELPLRKTDSDAILGFMDSYCQKNSIKIIRDGAKAIIEELKIK